jgi:hypothetical protein|tara:strand:- start:244 stop:780 length:537 start_codon:yes stop_codon:yes gene_type:complete
MTMKKIVILVLLSIGLCSCDKIDDLTKFDLDYTTQYTIASGAILDVPFDVLTPEVTTDSESEFESNDTRKDLIESIKLKKLTLNLRTPVSGNFNFLNEITIFIKADGLPEQVIASASDIPEDNLRSIDIETENVELKAYIKKDSYSLRVRTTTDRIISEDHEIDIRTVFRVDAKILGI